MGRFKGSQQEDSSLCLINFPTRSYLSSVLRLGRVLVNLSTWYRLCRETGCRNGPPGSLFVQWYRRCCWDECVESHMEVDSVEEYYMSSWQLRLKGLMRVIDCGGPVPRHGGLGRL